MTILDEQPVPPPAPGPQERAWQAAEAVAVDVMGAVNTSMARLVAAVRDLLAADGWVGWGIQSPEHWLCWKANVSRHRAEGLVHIARRAAELPECFALFQAGILGEDAMVRIARRVPADRDMDVAALAPELLVSQLDRLLASMPELPDPDAVPKAEPERSMELRTGRDGWTRGRFCLPADEGALVQTGLTAARDAEFRDRNDMEPDVEVHPELPDPDPTVRRVTWADGLVRMATVAIDALDGTLQRTGSPGDRHQLVLHRDIDPDGRLGPGQLEYGPVIPDWMARYLSVDAKTLHAAYAAGALIGLEPGDRHPNRKLRRYLARRDQGCTHPLCRQRRWLHAHHLVFWEDGGLTLPQNLVMLCPAHHRALHRGEFSIDGNPEDGTLVFRDRFGRPIAPPRPHPPESASDPGCAPEPGGGPPDGDSSRAETPDERSQRAKPSVRPPGVGPPARGYAPPSAERIDWRDFNWN
jgi:hypothetical protein